MLMTPEWLTFGPAIGINDDPGRFATGADRTAHVRIVPWVIYDGGARCLLRRLEEWSLKRLAIIVDSGYDMYVWRLYNDDPLLGCM